MVPVHLSYINTTGVSWCKRHTAEGNRGLSRGDTTTLLKLCFISAWLLSFSHKTVQPLIVGIREEGCALHKKGRGWDFLVCYRYVVWVTSFFLTIHSCLILIIRLGKLSVSQIWMHIPLLKYASPLFTARIRAFSFSAPGNLSLRSTSKTESPKKFLSLNTNGARTMVCFSRILSSCSHLLPICILQVFILIHFLSFLVISSFDSYYFSCLTSLSPSYSQSQFVP